MPKKGKKAKGGKAKKGGVCLVVAMNASISYRMK